MNNIHPKDKATALEFEKMKMNYTVIQMQPDVSDVINKIERCLDHPEFRFEDRDGEIMPKFTNEKDAKKEMHKKMNSLWKRNKKIASRNKQSVKDKLKQERNNSVQNLAKPNS